VKIHITLLQKSGIWVKNKVQKTPPFDENEKP